MTNKSICTLPKRLVRLWRHECLRVICDRLLNEEVSGWARASFPFLVLVVRGNCKAAAIKTI